MIGRDPTFLQLEVFRVNYCDIKFVAQHRVHDISTVLLVLHRYVEVYYKTFL